MAVFEPTIKRCVEWLSRHPDGCDTTEVTSGLQLTYPHVSGALCLAAERGLLRWVHAPYGNAHNRRVYFHPDHAPKVHGEASRKVSGGVKGKGVKAMSGWKAKAKARLDGAATEAQQHAGFSNRERAGPKVTVGPSTADTRFTVTTPEPFFSRPGYRPECIGADTWAAKVYGGAA